MFDPIEHMKSNMTIRDYYNLLALEGDGLSEDIKKEVYKEIERLKAAGDKSGDNWPT